VLSWFQREGSALVRVSFSGLNPGKKDYNVTPGIGYKLRAKVKNILSKILPDNNKLQYLINLPKFDKWKKNHREPYNIYQTRYDLYDYLNLKVLKNRPIDYVEFGVFRGESIQHWLTINTHLQSRFTGFDTFTGLPHPWEGFWETLERETFDAQGNVPEINDSRVTFIKGLFQETLPAFLTHHYSQLPLIIHIDSDLYSSALYVLTQCDHRLVHKSIVIFDEFSSILDEFRALEDYCSSYRRNYKVIGATHSYAQIAIQME
jgi:O-methyltransferase